MMKFSSLVLFFMIFAAFSQSSFFADSSLSFLVVQEARAQEWKDEFDDICGKTNNAMKLSREELKALIDRCDKLRVTINQLEETQKKVYLKRLSLCQDLYSYVLKSKEED